MTSLIALVLGALLALALPTGGGDAERVRGVTISTHRSGQEWASDGFAAELDRLAELGVNWIAVHPYARVAADGRLTWRSLGDEAAREQVARPIREAHARGMSILVVPHLAHWGSPFAWRGAVDFEEREALERFFSDYHAWIVEVAEAARAADGFCVGSELDRLVVHEGRWRALVAGVRAVCDARLTYAANWDAFERVPFWDALDAVGVQGYFPLAAQPRPDAAALARGWGRVVAALRAVHLRTGKPVVLTELGYDASLDAARAPWQHAGRLDPEARQEGRALQLACMRAALDTLERERSWLRGAFLWKWFVGPSRREDFRLDSQAMRALLAERWAATGR